MNDFTSVEFYMVVGLKEPRRPAWSDLTLPKITKGKPSIPRGKIALKFDLKVPRAIFEEFIPSGIIEVPEDGQIGRPALTVEMPEGIDLQDPGVRLLLVPFEEVEP